MTNFWKWTVENNTANEGEPLLEQASVRVLSLEGFIAEESWYADDITPAIFKRELHNHASEAPDDIIVRITSGGGDCFAAALIYDMLKEYGGKVTVEVHSLAASAASVIAVAGDKLLMSPLAILMIHNPTTVAIGEVNDFKAAINLLTEVKESIINAYTDKTKLPRSKVAKMMDDETWMSANKAMELGFVDGILYNNNELLTDEPADGFLYNKRKVNNCLVNKLIKHEKPVDGISAEQLEKRLNLLKVSQHI
ncbi:MAG: head maturation protease, ClpP-related [Eubacteriales bacterium]